MIVRLDAVLHVIQAIKRSQEGCNAPPVGPGMHKTQNGMPLEVWRGLNCNVVARNVILFHGFDLLSEEYFGRFQASLLKNQATEGYLKRLGKMVRHCGAMYGQRYHHVATEGNQDKAVSSESPRMARCIAPPVINQHGVTVSRYPLPIKRPTLVRGVLPSTLLRSHTN